MKKFNYCLLILFSILSACTNDDNVQLSAEELLTKNSPWQFNRYELINIIDAGNSSLTIEEIEEINNNDLSQYTLTFNDDGSGSTFIIYEGEEDTDEWQWEIINGNQLKIIYNTQEFDILDRFSVSNSELIIEEQSVTYDPQVTYEILHYGKFIFE